MRWKITLLNIPAFILAIPFTFFSVLAAFFGSEWGINPIALTILVTGCAIVPGVITCIVLSQANRSYFWAFVGLAIPFVPLVILFGAALVVPGFRS